MDKLSNIDIYIDRQWVTREIKGRQGEIKPQESEYPIHHKNIGDKIVGYKGK